MATISIDIPWLLLSSPTPFSFIAYRLGRSAEWRVWSVGQVARYVLAAAKEVRRIAKETDLAIAPGDHAVVW